MNRFALPTLLLLLIVSYHTQAQTTDADSSIIATNKHELGLRLSDLTDFGFVYKKQRKENRYRRLRAANILYTAGGPADALGSLSFFWGGERRKTIGKRLQFISGIELGAGLLFASGGEVTFEIDSDVFGVQATTTLEGSNLLFSPSIGYVLGFQYSVNESFMVSLETIPGIRAILYEGGATLNAGFSTQAVAVTVAYGFGNKSK